MLGCLPLLLHKAKKSVHVKPVQGLEKRGERKDTFGITGMSLIPHFGWKPIPKNPIPISSATALTYKEKFIEIITRFKKISRSLIRLQLNIVA